MRYYKQTADGYINCIGIGLGGEEISKEEYDRIKAVIHTIPDPAPGYEMRLTVSLEWVEVKIEDSNE